jgi:HK97 family phage major capsid protein
MSAEPRLKNVIALKSLATPSEQDVKQEAKAAEQVKPEAEAKPEPIQKVSIGETKMEDAQLQEMLTQVAEAAALKAIAATEPVKSSGGNIQIVTDEADRPFKSIAENLLAVKADVLTHGNSDAQYPRMKYLKATGASEGVQGDGGFLLDPTLAAEIIKPMHEAGPFSNAVRRLPVGTNSNYGWLNAVNETSRVTGSRWGGIQGYRLAEAATKVASKPTFRRINWELKKYAAVVVATDELLQDASMFSEIVRTGVAEELNFMLNDDIMNGLGLAGPQGFMQSGALITVTRTTGAKILGDDISAMYNRMDLRGRATANWYIGNDSTPQLDNLFAVGSTAVLYPYASIGADGVKYLYGRPVITTEFNASLNTTGDIALVDPTQYLLWEKGGIQSESSIHVYFLSDETAFRFVYRVDGKSSVNSALTPYKGSTTTSPFVVLGSAT